MKTGDKIRELCKENGISVTKLEEKLGFGNGSLTKNAYLRSDRLYVVAQYFGTTMESLMDDSGEKVRTKREKPLSNEEKSVLRMYNALSDEQKAFIFATLETQYRITREKTKQA